MAQENLLKIALVGNPNSGKSTLFNILTGLNQKVANFPGVTVDKKTGYTNLQRDSKAKEQKALIVDLPGTYSLYPKSPDESIAYKVLCDPKDALYPDVTVVIADATNLKRSLFVCTQVIDLKMPVVLALNMMDIAEKQGIEIDVKALSKALGIPVIPISARSNIGIDELKQAALQVELPAKAILDAPYFKEESFKGLMPLLEVEHHYRAFLFANNLETNASLRIYEEQLQKAWSWLRANPFNAKKLQAQETLDRYNAISAIISKTVAKVNAEGKMSLTDKLDKVLTHTVWGYVCFLMVMFMMFQAIFSWSAYPMEFVEQAFIHLEDAIRTMLPGGWFSSLIVDGVLAGLSGIVVFIPQIAMLFFFIAILEDSGYMARVSYIMDKLMRKLGLNGKSVIPLISGVACAVPAIMSTRTIQNWRERLITIMITPLMSCSARIPVYTLLISMVVPDKYVFGLFNLQGLMLMVLYLSGFVAALLAALVMRIFIKVKERSYFIMELPIYRSPRWSNIGLSIVEKVKLFLFDAGKVIIAISIVLWLLSSFAPGDKFKQIEQKYALAKADTSIHFDTQKQGMQSEKLEASYAGIVGHWLEPAIRPLGFDWKIGIALVTSFAAREVFVGTMATIYTVGNDSQLSVREKMMAEKDPETGLPRYTFAVGMSLMFFYVFAMQCMSTLAVVYRETKNWRWPIIQVIYMSGLAYLSSLLIYQLLK